MTVRSYLAAGVPARISLRLARSFSAKASPGRTQIVPKPNGPPMQDSGSCPCTADS